ncbi:MAG: PQQ-binding-like beta-propeller repeat protein [Saprospiraceae bacterium]|nr:PQQ-binding-like beta-propeller repeat protein [Saprospiraceae bacterium]
MNKSIILIGVFLTLLSCGRDVTDEKGWSRYRGDDGINAYSPLSQINKSNVQHLQVAWTYRTGDFTDFSKIECNPIIISGVLYGVSAKMKVFALEADTGREIWVYDPFEPGSKESGFNRGLTYWEDGDDKRILVGAKNKLIALNALTGKPFPDFGENGFVDLRKNLRSDTDFENYDVTNTSPGVVFEDLIIVGSSLRENYEALSGDIRAYDVRTGKMRWTFHTLPHPGEFGYDTWSEDSYKNIGGANAWAGVSIDRRRGLVFAATGAPAFDFHGGERKGQNLFANCVIALDAASGKYVWHFQTSHHDLWDYDLPTPPNLTTIRKDGKDIDAVVQLTKQGLIFMLDRDTGKPIYPVEERVVPSSGLADESTWPTQPFPAKPLPLTRTTFDESIITDISPEAHDFIKTEAGKYSWGSIYQPPSLQGIIQLPGFRGGAEWSGGAIDQETGILFVGLNDIPNIVQLVAEGNDKENLSGQPLIEVGSRIYHTKCTACHGEDRKGNPGFPSLVDLSNRMKSDNALHILKNGQRNMPAFTELSEEQLTAVVSFLFDINKDQTYQSEEPIRTTLAGKPMRYRIKGYKQLLDADGYPGIKPPWGTLCALDLNSTEIKWRVPLGEYPDLVAKGIRNTGTQLFGGGIVTQGGLVFIGASQDEKFRAFDKDSGEVLWEYQLPAGGYATPATYDIDGTQYVVIAAGGGGFQGTKTSDHYIAFSLK